MSVTPPSITATAAAYMKIETKTETKMNIDQETNKRMTIMSVMKNISRMITLKCKFKQDNTQCRPKAKRKRVS